MLITDFNPMGKVIMLRTIWIAHITILNNIKNRKEIQAIENQEITIKKHFISKITRTLVEWKDLIMSINRIVEEKWLQISTTKWIN